MGDCYVVSSNLYSPAKDAASRVVRFGLALVEMADGLQSAILEVSTRAPRREAEEWRGADPTQ